jgi:hypothetical protein
MFLSNLETSTLLFVIALPEGGEGLELPLVDLLRTDCIPP